MHTHQIQPRIELSVKRRVLNTFKVFERKQIPQCAVAFSAKQKRVCPIIEACQAWQDGEPVEKTQIAANYQQYLLNDFS